MTNTNCLAGKACPQCKQAEELSVVATLWVSVIDNGVEDIDMLQPYEYDDTAPAACEKCGFTGTWGDFST